MKSLPPFLPKRNFSRKKSSGSLVLILSKLQNLLVFMLSSRLAPVSIVEELEKIIRLFLWCTKEGKKIHLVSFERICLPRLLGGLGIKHVKRD